MAQISALQVKTLREQTGVGMMECKNALQECDGDLKKATKLLRERGAAKAVKRAGRATKEGKIAAKISDDNRTGSMVEVNIETDFAARGEKFGGLVDVACDTTLAGCFSDLDALLAAKPISGEAASIQEMVADIQTVIGENMGISRCVTLQVPADQTGLVCSYIHPPGKVGVLVQLASENEAVAGAENVAELARDLCLQIAFSNPVSLDSSSIPADVVESERDIYRNQALQSGKPESILDKIIEGRMQSFFKESCLLDQAFVKEEKKSVSDVVAEAGKVAGGSLKIVAYSRFQLGDAAGDEA